MLGQTSLTAERSISPLLVGSVILLIDQALKWLLLALRPDWLVGNRGVALGQLTYIPSRLLILIILTAVSGLLYWVATRQSLAAPIRWGTSLFIAGALSNLFDRLFHGAIVDYVPVGSTLVNLGDLAIVTGLVVLAYYSLKPR